MALFLLYPPCDDVVVRCSGKAHRSQASAEDNAATNGGPSNPLGPCLTIGLVCDNRPRPQEVIFRANQSCVAEEYSRSNARTNKSDHPAKARHLSTHTRRTMRKKHSYFLHNKQHRSNSTRRLHNKKTHDIDAHHTVTENSG